MNDNFATSWKRFEELISWMGPEPVDLPPLIRGCIHAPVTSCQISK